MLFNHNRHLYLAALTITLSTLATTASATDNTQPCNFSTQIKFTESAPRDRFTIRNTSVDNWSVNAIVLDLTQSKGKLIFDVTAEGAGVEVFQPFRSEGDAAGLKDQPVVGDGDQSISLAFSSFTPGEEFVFTIDVDDQLTNSALGQIRVAGSEMEGATVTMDIMSDAGELASVAGVFDDNSQIQFTMGNCLSMDK